MKPSISVWNLASLTSALLMSTAALANDITAAEEDMATKWAQSVDMNKDHMVSKAEVMAMVEKAFAAADTKKAGKLDMKQLAVMLREFDPRAVGVRSITTKP